MLQLNNGYLYIEPAAMKRLGTLQVLIPRVVVGQQVKQGQALFAVESSRCLLSLKAPADGKVLNIDFEAVARPFNVTASTPVMALSV